MRDISPGILTQKPIEIVATEFVENEFATERLRKRRQIAVFALSRAENEDLLQCRLVSTRKESYY